MSSAILCSYFKIIETLCFYAFTITKTRHFVQLKHREVFQAVTPLFLLVVLTKNSTNVRRLFGTLLFITLRVLELLIFTLQLLSFLHLPL
jgi:hypothetical protein